MYQAAKTVESYETLRIMELFESIERFLGRLEISAKITSSEARKDILVKVMIEIISALAVATKEVKQSRASEARLR